MNLERLYFLREEFDLTQEDIGKIVGTKKYSIYNWESGKEIIPLSKLKEIEKQGIKIDSDEINFENSYQIVIKIDKNN